VFGESESGKTNLARVIIRELIDHYTDEHVVFALFDLCRTLLDTVPEPYLGAYAPTAPVAAGLAGGLASELKNRLPPEDVTTQQLKYRSWWKGPEIVVLAADFDLVSPAGPGPLAPRLEYLPQAETSVCTSCCYAAPAAPHAVLEVHTTMCRLRTAERGSQWLRVSSPVVFRDHAALPLSRPDGWP
jgi:hypothetical protein